MCKLACLLSCILTAILCGARIITVDDDANDGDVVIVAEGTSRKAGLTLRGRILP